MRRVWFALFTWSRVTQLNQRLCMSGQAQHGTTSDGHDSTMDLWEDRFDKPMLLIEALDLCLAAHRGAPFLNFNGNTFAVIARNTLSKVSEEHELTAVQQEVLLSQIGHYVAGVLDRESVLQALQELNLAD